MKKRIICALMAAGMMALSFTACSSDGSSSTTTDSSSNGSSETGSSESASTESAIDMEGDPYHVIFMYLNISEGEGFDEVQNAVNELSLKEINMETELLPVSYGTMTTTTQMMLASNEPLDLFMDVMSNMPTYITSGYIADWSDYMGQIPDVVDYYGDQMEAGRIGDFMALIGTVKERPNNYGLVARKDIMDELGYSVDDFAIDPNDPSSYDKLDEMFAAVKAAYPGMTAVAGQQSIASYGTYDALSDSFGVLEDYGQSTEVVDHYETEQFKNMVTISKRWYDAGYYSADVVTSQDTGETLLKAGNMFSYVVGIKPNTAQEKLAQCGYEVEIIPLAGTPIYTSAGYNNFGYCLANASEDKDKAAAYYNWVFTSGEFHDLINWGIEGTDWVEDANGQAAFPEGMDGSNYRYHNDQGWIYPNQTAGHVWAGNPSDIWEQYDAATNEAIKSAAFGFTYDSTAVTDQVIACTAVNSQYQKALWFGAVDDVDSAIEEYVNALKNSGLDTIIEEKQTQLDAWLAENGSASTDASSAAADEGSSESSAEASSEG